MFLYNFSGITCRPSRVTKGTQTESASQPVIVPVMVPIYLPVPMQMYQRPLPVPVPMPLPIPGKLSIFDRFLFDFYFPLIFGLFQFIFFELLVLI